MKRQTAFLNLKDYHYDILNNVSTLFFFGGGGGGKNIENQQITPAKYSVLMLRVRQNEHKVAFWLSRYS